MSHCLVWIGGEVLGLGQLLGSGLDELAGSDELAAPALGG
jgi:hypothetical protein